MNKPAYTFEEWETEQLKDPEFRAAVRRREPSYWIIHLRTMRGLTQKELADRLGTHQSSISRLENGTNEPNVGFLRRVVEALGGTLEIRITAPELEAAAQPVPCDIIVATTDRNSGFEPQDQELPEPVDTTSSSHLQPVEWVLQGMPA